MADEEEVAAPENTAPTESEEENTDAPTESEDNTAPDVSEEAPTPIKSEEILKDDGPQDSPDRPARSTVWYAKISIKKIQVSPGKQFDLGREDSLTNYLTNLPVIPVKAKTYTPMPYTFRVKGVHKSTKVTHVVARTPPFYLLLDHTIAVIWQLFSDNNYNSPLGIAQVQWCLSFLKTIINRQGDHPKDVEFCIDMVEKVLLDKYAELAKELPKIDKIYEKTQYFDGFYAAPSLVTKAVPFSLNYNEMINKCPEPEEDMFSTQATPSTMTQEQIDDEIDNIKNTKDSSDTPLSKGVAINFLNMYKSDKIDKLREDLKRLKSLEELMEQIDQDHFQGYTENDLNNLLQ